MPLSKAASKVSLRNPTLEAVERALARGAEDFERGRAFDDFPRHYKRKSGDSPLVDCWRYGWKMRREAGIRPGQAKK